MKSHLTSIAGALSVITLLGNWLFIAYMTRPDPSLAHLPKPLAAHPISFFCVLMLIGVFSAIYAATKSSRLWAIMIWFMMAGLNFASFFLELCAS
jgi:hypothetical protein